MPNLAKLVANRVSAVIDFGASDEAIHVEYYPARLTTRMLATYSSATPDALRSASPEQALALLGSPTETLLALLASWDLTETVQDGPDAGAERVLPIDRPTLEALGISVQWTILNGLLSAQSGQDGSQDGQGKVDAAEAPVNAPSSAAS